MDTEHTLVSPDFSQWCIVALESGMQPADVEAVTLVRLRLMAAARLCQEIGAPASQAVAVMREICATVHQPVSWPTY